MDGKINGRGRKTFKVSKERSVKERELHMIGILDEQTNHSEGIASIVRRLHEHSDWEQQLEKFGEEMKLTNQPMSIEWLIKALAGHRNTIRELQTERNAAWTQAVADGKAAGEKWAVEHHYVPLEELKKMTILEIAQKYLVLL